MAVERHDGCVVQGSNPVFCWPAVLPVARSYQTAATTSNGIFLASPYPTSTNSLRVIPGFQVKTTPANRPPTAPTLVTPATGASLSSTPSLVATLNEPDADTGTLSFQLCSDAACTTVLQSGSSAAGIAAGSNGTWTPTSLSSGTYYWRALETDTPGLAGPYSATFSFTLTSNSITLGVDSATLNAGMAMPGTDVTATNTLNITTTGATTGYTVTANDGNDAVGMTSGVNTILDWSGTDLAPSVWASGNAGFGVTVLHATGGRLAKWGPGTNTSATDFVNNKYAGLKGSSEVTLSNRTGVGVVTNDTAVISFRAQPSASQVAGVYTTTVTYTATAYP